MSYAQFGYPYHPASQLLMSGQSPGGGGGGGGGGTGGSVGTVAAQSPPCCESGARTLVTDPVTGQTVFACQQCDTHSAIVYPRPTSGAPTGGLQSPTSGGVHQPPPSYVSYSAATADQSYPPSAVGMDSSTFYSSLGAPYVLKDGSADVTGWQSMAQPTGYYPYDPSLAAYGYGYDLNGARRKNATREATATLKAWLNEHRKNPYPTKGEKIMLAIITKMTLTQVSTWFANARRRLKKDNKITWDIKGSKEEEDEDDDDEADDDDVRKPSEDHKDHLATSGGQSAMSKQARHDSPTLSKSTNSVHERPNELKTFGHDLLRTCDGASHHVGDVPSNIQQPNLVAHSQHHRLPCSPSVSSSPATSPSSSTSSSNVPLAGVYGHPLPSCYSMPPSEMQRYKAMCSGDGGLTSLVTSINPQTIGNKPKIWSLADTATCKTPPSTNVINHSCPLTSENGSGFGVHGEWTPFSGLPVQRTMVQGLPPVPPFQMAPSASSPTTYRSHFQQGAYLVNNMQDKPAVLSSTSSSAASTHAHLGNPTMGAFSELQTDTPPQTPPNHKFPANFGVTGSGAPPPPHPPSAAGYGAPEVYNSSGGGGQSSRTLLSSVNSRLHDFPGTSNSNRL